MDGETGWMSDGQTNGYNYGYQSASQLRRSYLNTQKNRLTAGIHNYTTDMHIDEYCEKKDSKRARGQGREEQTGR